MGKGKRPATYEDIEALPPGWVGELLQSRNRAKAAPTFGPEGLYLETIEYEHKWGLPI